MGLPSQIIKDLTKELEVSRLEKEAMVTELHSPSPYVAELTTQLESLKHQNRCKCTLVTNISFCVIIYIFYLLLTALKDSYDELQASTIAKGVERGRMLLTESPSLASELDGLTHDDVSVLLNIIIFIFIFIYNIIYEIWNRLKMFRLTNI